MGTVILVRHGESETNTKGMISSDYEGFPLTQKGRDQAKETSEQLVKIPIDAFLTSPVQRARETADIISERLGLEPVIEDRIRESGMGKYNNTQFSAIPRLKRSELGMETWDSHQKRLLEAVNSFKGTGLLVSHAFPIRSLIGYFLNMNEEESYGINIRNATMSVIDLESREVMCIGSRHLTEKVRIALIKEG